VSGANTVLSNTPIVFRGTVIGEGLFTGAGSTGAVYGYLKSDGSSKWNTAGDLKVLSPVTASPSGTLYFSDSANKELVAADLASSPSTPPTTSWTFTGSGLATITTPGFTGAGSQPTVDANGVVYFGADNGNVYAIIGDTNPHPPPASGNDWPSVGHDNCNTGNTTFTCQ
jgi:outer membrane protein assembly factor BamB